MVFYYLHFGFTHRNTFLKNPVPQKYALFNHKVTVVPIEHQIAIFTPFQYLGQIVQKFIKRLTKHQEIIHEHFNSVLYFVGENWYHAMLEGCWSIAQPK